MSGYTVDGMQRVRRIVELQEQGSIDRDVVKYQVTAGNTLIYGVKIGDALFDDDQQLLTVFYNYGQSCAVIPYAEVQLIVVSFVGPGELVRP